MSSRVGGAVLALIAAGALGASVATPAWFSGNPTVGNQLVTGREVHVGLLGAEMCNTGDGEAGRCVSRDPKDSFQITAFAELGVVGATALLLLVLAVLPADKRRGLAKLTLVATLLAGGGGAALLVLGPTDQGTIPIGYSFFALAGGFMFALFASVLGLRKPAPPTQRAVERVSQHRSQNPSQNPLAPPGPQPLDIVALLGENQLHPASLGPEPKLRTVPPSPGGALAGPSGPLVPPVQSGAQPLFSSAPQLRPLYEANPTQGGTGGLVQLPPKPLPTRAPTPIPRASVAAIAGIPTPPPQDLRRPKTLPPPNFGENRVPSPDLPEPWEPPGASFEPPTFEHQKPWQPPASADQVVDDGARWRPQPASGDAPAQPWRPPPPPPPNPLRNKSISVPPQLATPDPDSYSVGSAPTVPAPPAHHPRPETPLAPPPPPLELPTRMKRESNLPPPRPTAQRSAVGSPSIARDDGRQSGPRTALGPSTAPPVPRTSPPTAPPGSPLRESRESGPRTALGPAVVPSRDSGPRLALDETRDLGPKLDETNDLDSKLAETNDLGPRSASASGPRMAIGANGPRSAPPDSRPARDTSGPRPALPDPAPRVAASGARPALPEPGTRASGSRPTLPDPRPARDTASGASGARPPDVVASDASGPLPDPGPRAPAAEAPARILPARPSPVPGRPAKPTQPPSPESIIPARLARPTQPPQLRAAVPMPMRSTPSPALKRTPAAPVIPTPPAIPPLAARHETDPGDHFETVEREKVNIELPRPKAPTGGVSVLDGATDPSIPVSAFGVSTPEEQALAADEAGAPRENPGDVEGGADLDDAIETVSRERLSKSDLFTPQAANPPPATPPAPAEPPQRASAVKLPITTAPTSLPPPKNKPQQSSGPSPACPQCEAPMAWVEEHLRFYCKSCRMYF